MKHCTYIQFHPTVWYLAPYSEKGMTVLGNQFGSRTHFLCFTFVHEIPALAFQDREEFDKNGGQTVGGQS